MTLYGYSREPDPAAQDEVDIRVPEQRIASDPVPVPTEGPDGVDTLSDEPTRRATGPVFVGAAATLAPQSPAPALVPVPVPEPAPPTAAPAVPRPVSPAAAPDAAAWLEGVQLDDGPDLVPPWDRRPLMVVIAAGVALVLLAVISGVVASSMFAGPDNGSAWQTPGGPVGPTGAPSSGPAGPGVANGAITLSGVGDVIMGTLPGKLPPKGGEGFFDAVKDALAADLVMGNLETPLTENTGVSKCPADSNGCFQFYLPPSYANHLKAGGFQVLNLANNHTNDMGSKGLAFTRAALDAAGINHTGAPNQITYVEVKGVRVAVLGFAIYSWGQNLNNIPAAEALVRQADETADIVAIQMQGGAEGSDRTHVKPGHELFLGEDRGDLMKFSRAVIDAGADVVFGHGPHIMRGMEFYKGRLIAYSLGNFCGYGTLNSSGFLGVGGVLKVTLNRDGSWVRGTLVATEMVKGGLPQPDGANRAWSFVNGLSKTDFGAAAAQISPTDGSIAGPLTP